MEGLNAIKWSPETIQDLENTVLNGLTGVACANVRQIVSLSCKPQYHACLL